MNEKNEKKTYRNSIVLFCSIIFCLGGIYITYDYFSLDKTVKRMIKKDIIDEKIIDRVYKESGSKALISIAEMYDKKENLMSKKADKVLSILAKKMVYKESVEKITEVSIKMRKIGHPDASIEAFDIVGDKYEKDILEEKDPTKRFEKIKEFIKFTDEESYNYHKLIEVLYKLQRLVNGKTYEYVTEKLYNALLIEDRFEEAEKIRPQLVTTVE